MSFPDPLRSNKPLIRSKTAADWTAGDYYLAVGELGVESDTGNFKVGVGDNWTDTSYTYSDATSDGNTYGRKDGAWVDLASAAALQFRQGTDAERLAMDPVPASGEPIYTTDTNRFFIGDGTTTGGRGIVTDSDAYVICQPGDDLLAKYTAAKSLTPGGNAKSATNRAALIIYPGAYDIGSQTLDIDADYVDVIALGSEPLHASAQVVSSAVKAIRYGGEDVAVAGLYGTSSAAPGGAKRLIYNCGADRYFYDIGGESLVDGLPAVIEGTLTGCYCGVGSSLGFFCGSSSTVHVFNGIVRRCYASRGYFQNTVFQGEMSDCDTSPTNVFAYFGGAMQGWVRYTKLSYVLPARSAWDNSDPTAFGAACTISNASPAVVTSSSHGLQSGMRIHLATNGALPSGLSAGTTYYVKVVDANSFEVSTSLNGSSVNTSSAGSGSHTVEKPTGRDGGWYTYCTYNTSEFTST